MPGWVRPGLWFHSQIPDQRFVELACLRLPSFGRHAGLEQVFPSLPLRIDRVFNKLLRLLKDYRAFFFSESSNFGPLTMTSRPCRTSRGSNWLFARSRRAFGFMTPLGQVAEARPSLTRPSIRSGPQCGR
jgi:hypothetical protein